MTADLDIHAARWFEDSSAVVLNERAVEIGHEIFRRTRRMFSSGEGSAWERALMDLGMRDERVKAQLFRFIDVLPGLTSFEQVNRHLHEYMADVADHLPALARGALNCMPTGGWLGQRMADFTLYNTRHMARRFIAATDLPEATKAVTALRHRKLGFTIDLLGEAVLSEAEADIYQGKYLDLIEGLSAQGRSWPRIDQIDYGAYGRVPAVNVSIKLSSLFSQFDPINPEGTEAAVIARLRPILRLARARGVFVNIDMEQYAFKDLTLRIFKRIFSDDEFHDWDDVGIAIQGYLRDTGEDLRSLAAWAKERHTPIWVRLVKGAYWDFETVIAAQNDWPVPVWEHKSQTDAAFEAHTRFLMSHYEHLRPAIASHNVRSIANALAQAEAARVPPGGWEFQMLYGMAEPIKAALVSMGQRVRVYTPFGELLPGMAYLVRRLLENTSNESFLRAGFHDKIPEEQLLMNPLNVWRHRSALAPEPSSRPAASLAHANGGNGHGQTPAPGITLSRFRNEPLVDFSREANRRLMTEALEATQVRLGGSYPLVIAGHRVDAGKWITSVNPSKKEQVVGRASSAMPGQAAAAVDAARDAFPAWRDAPVAKRVGMLLASAAIMRRRRFELAAWEIFETGKGWREADADVAEAIDYCEYYAREMLRLSSGQHRYIPGEENEYFYEPRGVVVTIAPWNFPLAILCGMTAAALVAGNTVVMKPAEQSPIIAAKLMEIFYEAGFPNGVVNYLPGVGEEIGPTLTQHPDVAMIAFTGSRPVGLAIAEAAAKTPPGQTQVKRVVIEMGGKNAIIIDDDADLDEAVNGVVASAFGYAGQKCSACSRVIVLNAIYDAFVHRLVEATRSLKIGPANDPSCFFGPVIDAEAQARILSTIAKATTEHKVAYSADPATLPDNGFYVPPTIFVDVPPDAAIAQGEIFGPVLAVILAADMTEALAIANGTHYALTGGVYSRSPAMLERVRHEFRVGNLYLNRKITGALVDRQPFGGMKLSGIGSKAGGPDYLTQFLIPRTITENTLRHGFAPTNEEQIKDQPMKSGPLTSK